MTNKGAYMTDFESRCYGMSTTDIREEYMNSITAKCSGLEMVVMSILSDCQELLGGLSVVDARDERRQEMIRQQMNVAKYILSEMMGAKEAA